MNNFIKFSTDIIAANSSKRELTGVIVPFGEDKVGHTNMGDVVFKAGSLKIGEGIKLFTEHDMTRPIGKLSRYEEDNEKIVGVFKIARTNAGDDALAEAQEGLRTGFSVGAMIDDYVTKGELVIVNAATLREVSHVTFPAFGEYAQITDVAASESEQPTESEETIVSNEVTPEVVEEVAAEVVATPAVEAKERNARPAIFTAPRSPIVSKGSYLEHNIRAALGNEDSRQYVMAADTTGNNAAFIPTPQSQEVINGIANADRGIIDAISRGTLPTSGMSFEIPKITTAPTVAQANEEAALSETDTASSFVSVSVKKFGGQQTLSVELLDRSSPVFFDELVRQMEFAYAKATDSFVGTTMQGAGTLNATAQDNDREGLIAYVSSAAAAVYSASLGFARALIVTPEQWGNIMGYNEAGRPIYTASQPSNAGGAVSPQSLRGSVAGLELYVSRNFTGSGGVGTADYSMAVVNPDAYTWYESPRLSLRTNVINTGQIDVNYYGYGALATKIAAGANWFNLT
jgi:HK97 family phage prohead protease/HK97 family phage major capsid protein